MLQTVWRRQLASSDNLNFPLGFFGSSRHYFRDKKFTFIDILKRQTKVTGKADPMHFMKECEGLEV